MPDAHVNFGISSVATAPSPATTGASLVLATGDGANMPAVPFNMTVWPAGSRALKTNAEIIRVTAISGDTLSTIVRAQEGSTARSITVGDNIAVTITAKTLTDAESAAWTAVVSKSTDESVTSSTTMQNDDELFFATTSGGVYEIELVIIYASPSGGGTPDLKCAFGEDATARGVLTQICFEQSDAAFSGAFLAQNTPSVGTYGTATSNRTVWIRGTYVGGGGTFRFVWAQGNSNANAVTVRAGSVLRYRKIA